MVIEIERAFLAKHLPENLERTPKKEVIDIYIPTKGDHPILRIRKNGEKYEMTKKYCAKEDGEFHEHTIPLTPKEFEELNNSLEGKRVSKMRYFYEHAGKTWEIGVFQDDLKGFVLIEVEFEEGEDKSVELPEFCGPEVTGAEWKAGGYLAGKSYEDIELQLKKHNYERI